MSGFDPGRLRQRVAIERPEPTADGAGGETVGWVPVATVWAAIAPAGAHERARAAHLSAVITHTVTIRHRDDLAGGMRLIHRGRTFRVRTVHDPDERRRHLVLACEEEDA